MSVHGPSHYHCQWQVTRIHSNRYSCPYLKFSSYTSPWENKNPGSAAALAGPMALYIAPMGTSLLFDQSQIPCRCVLQDFDTVLIAKTKTFCIRRVNSHRPSTFICGVNSMLSNSVSASSSWELSKFMWSTSFVTPRHNDAFPIVSCMTENLLSQGSSKFIFCALMWQ